MAAVAAAALFERLKELGCPALEGVYLSEAKDMQKLLCTPSAHRLDILEWICIKVYPPLREQFSSLKESQSDLKIKGIAKLGYDLWLSRADDLDLIEGKACAQKQLSFLQQLVAAIPHEGHFTVSDSSSSTVEYFQEMAIKSEEFLKQVFCSPDLQAVLNPKCHPWSPDIKRLLVDKDTLQESTEESFQEIANKNEEFVKQVFSSSDPQAMLNPECHPWSPDIKPFLVDEDILEERTLPSATSHERTLLDSLKELEERSAALEDLRAQCPFLQGDPAGADASRDGAMALQTLQLLASDFSQLLVAFEQVYEDELQQYCDRPTPQLNPCGPLFQAVHRGLLLCVQELQSLAQVTETSEHVMEKVKAQHGEEVDWSGSVKATLPSKLEELQQKYKAIHAMLEDCQ
ncbi:HAUS augmin-like complex subunit 7 isoform X1 [Elgaria multicarinata webbii]|uniref:HAUS augmin-like complex subunit 7 isoform X1 n=1 Tax=Elgaria multicarinata webbii TaxID=159646 RepID=UPI002FCCC7F7